MKSECALNVCFFLNCLEYVKTEMQPVPVVSLCGTAGPSVLRYFVNPVKEKLQ